MTPRIIAWLLLGLLSSGVLGQPLPLQAVDFVPQPGAQIPLDAVFQDHDGRDVTLGQCIDDRPTVLVLAYYRCPMLCTLTMKALVDSLGKVPYSAGRTYGVVVISIDPRERAELAAAARQKAMSQLGEETGPGLHFLTDPHRQASRVADAIGYRYAYDPTTDQWAHPAGIVVLTSSGLAARYLLGIDYPARDLKLALLEASEGRIGGAVDRVLLRCYRYDPLTGRYGLMVTNLMRGFAVAFAVAGSVGMVWLWRVDRRRSQLLRGGST